MKKQQKQLTALLVILFVLVVGFLGLQYYNKRQEDRSQELQGETVLSIEDDIVRISYDYEGTQYEYDKVDDTWYYTPDHDLTLYQYRLQHIVEKSRLLTATAVITDVTDLSQYGLAEGYQTVTLETGNESYTLWIGDENAITGDRYVCLPQDDTTVYAVDNTFAVAFELNVEDIIDENAAESTAEETGEETQEEGTEAEESGTEDGSGE